ncbi:NADPH-dependent oxidoreductase [Paraburkholderia tropica]|uniref:NADPH-dependent oxidoreductase n=1 Tax=Paraburkholderia tropica TaxID=92647 RepID=UPI001592A5EE|nr:NADPH-dependent oxidoreductase [Paraburkholderia tropica]
MNETVARMQSHRSIRDYLDTPVPDAVLREILEAAWRGPTSINGQHVSLVVVRDETRRRTIADLAGGQPWIAQAPVFVTIVADFHKTDVALSVAGAKQVIHESVEGFATAALDVGIALANIMTAAQSCGLGVVPIGGIRRDPQAMIELLALPPLTFPLAGVALGYPADLGHTKPRLPYDSFVHQEVYDGTLLVDQIESYDKNLAEHWRTIDRADGEPWSVSIAGFYRRVYYPNVAVAAREQGFGFEQ